MTGATGVSGTVGPQGMTGATGVEGATGVSGTAGTIGPQGMTGATGVSGTAGTVGPQGMTGATGVSGTAGTVGPQGMTGATGPGLEMTSQSSGRIPYCSSTSNIFSGSNNFTYDEITNTLNVTNPFHININGVQPISNYALCSDGAGGGMKYTALIDTGMRVVNTIISSQLSSTTNNSITLYQTL